MACTDSNITGDSTHNGTEPHADIEDDSLPLGFGEDEEAQHLIETFTFERVDIEMCSDADAQAARRIRCLHFAFCVADSININCELLIANQVSHTTTTTTSDTDASTTSISLTAPKHLAAQFDSLVHISPPPPHHYHHYHQHR
jgi:hypothetical protein